MGQLLGHKLRRRVGKEESQPICFFCLDCSACQHGEGRCNEYQG